MTTTLGQKISEKPLRKDRATEARRVASALDRICDSMKPGERMPTHTALMAQIGASERIVLRALGDLCNAGRIVRRPKSGTFLADPRSPSVERVPTDTENRTIVAITQPDHAFLSRNIELLMKLGQASNYTILFQPVDNASLVTIPPHGSARAPHGYIVIGSAFVPLAERIAQAGHRAVAIGEPKPGHIPVVSRCYVDNSQGGFLIAEYLIRLGHRRLAIGDVSTDFQTWPRWEGHQRAVAEAAASGIETTTVIITGDEIDVWKSQPGTAAAFLGRPDAPTALSVWNDTFAIKLMAILQRDGIRIPDDVSVVGYDNLPISGETTPLLTTVETDVTNQLRIALRLLTHDPPTNATTVLMSPTLVVRESTAPPRNNVSRSLS